MAQGPKGSGIGERVGEMVKSPVVPLAGAGLGQLPDPNAVESLGLPIIPNDDSAGTLAQAAAGMAEPDANTAGVSSNVDKPEAGSKRGKEAEHQPFIVSEGLPPVPQKLVAKILRLEFVDMAELLQDNVEAERRRGKNDTPCSSSAHRTARREIPDILSWTQCFGIYVSVMASKYPTRVPMMLAYQTTLLREARRCGGAGWQNYDSSFRQLAACNPKADWSKINTSLYAVTFTSQANGRGKCCQFCLEADHSGAECALSPTQRPDRQERQRLTGLGLPAKSPGDGRRAFGEGRSDAHGGPKDRGYMYSRRRQPSEQMVCYSYNEGACRFPGTCRYQHICQKCQAEDHPACRCPTYPAARKEPAK